MMDESFSLAPSVRRLTVNLDDEDVTLFEDTWPVPQGVALHSYLVEGRQRVLVDPWDAGGYGPEELAVDLGALGLKWSDVTAVAFTRAPDPGLEARLRAQQPALEWWGLPTPGAVHDLGQGVTLEERGGFWMCLPAGVWFSGDSLSGLGWIEDETWTEDLGEDARRYFEGEALRWFSARPVVPSVPPGAVLVAPAHGCPWKDPHAAVALAQRFEDWATEGLDEITVVWPSGADEGADALVGGVLDAGAGLNLFRVPGDDPTAVAAGARRASLVVLAEALDDSFLRGLDKALWRPKVSTPAAQLRAQVVDHWQGLGEGA